MKHSPLVPPDGAEHAFAGTSFALAQQYAGLLASAGVLRGLIGPREVPRIWDRHLLNCVVVEQLLAPGAKVCDLGSGAGLPGIVLAIARPDLSLTLVEPLLRRTTFLEEAVSQMGLTNVRIVRDRAEGLHGVERFDAVTSRALAPLSKLLGWSMPLVASTGYMLALKGSSAAEEISAAQPELRELDCGKPEVLTLSLEAGPSTTTVVRVSWKSGSQVG